MSSTEWSVDDFTGQYVPDVSYLSCVIGPDAVHSLEGVEIGEVYHRFLYGEVKITVEDILLDIRDNLVEVFDYQKLHLLSHLRVEVSCAGRRFEVKHLSDYSLDDASGVCNELALKAYRIIRAKYPALDMVIIEGVNQRFAAAGYNHFFLLVGDTLLAEQGDEMVRISSNEDIVCCVGVRQQTMTNARVVDPTSHVVDGVQNTTCTVKHFVVYRKIEQPGNYSIEFTDESKGSRFVALAACRDTGLFIDLRFLKDNTVPHIGVELTVGNVEVLPHHDDRIEELLAPSPRLLAYVRQLRQLLATDGVIVLDHCAQA
jgi:hypothetical protein